MVVVVVAGLYSAERRVGVCVCVCEGVMWKKGAIKRRVVKEGWGGHSALVPGRMWRAAR